MLSVLRYLRGYLKLEFRGDYVEEILNLSAKNSIKMWDIARRRGLITAAVSIADFKRYRAIIKNKKIRVKILKKCGFPFFVRRYNRRIGFILGAVIFMLILEFFSSFIWEIKVSGNANISAEEIISRCREIGITEGVRTTKINTQNDAQRLLLKTDGVAWASLNIEGCILTVNISEIKNNTISAEKKPSNLKASLDGIIKKIDVTSGDVLVKSGDVVKKGDVLVSGIIEKLESTLFVCSRGTITAQTEREFTAEADFKQTVKTAVGKNKKRYMLTAFGFDIPLYLGSIKGECVSQINTRRINAFGGELPVTLTTYKYKCLKEEKIVKDRKTLEGELLKQIESEIKKLNLESYKIKEKNIYETGSGIKISICYLCEENIALEDEILLAS